MRPHKQHRVADFDKQAVSTLKWIVYDSFFGKTHGWMVTPQVINGIMMAVHVGWQFGWQLSAANVNSAAWLGDGNVNSVA
jgi:hypothetical protein